MGKVCGQCWWLHGVEDMLLAQNNTLETGNTGSFYTYGSKIYSLISQLLKTTIFKVKYLNSTLHFISSPCWRPYLPKIYSRNIKIMVFLRNILCTGVMCWSLLKNHILFQNIRPFFVVQLHHLKTNGMTNLHRNCACFMKNLCIPYNILS
jgi:hypothetical protein